MDELDFTLELNSEHLSQETEYDLFTMAESQLTRLAKGNDDLTGAAVSLKQPAHGETSYLHEATVVVYSRPEHVAATEKADNPQRALQGALDAVERQIRDRREKLKKRWERPGNHPIEQEVVEILAAEGDDAIVEE